MIRFRDEYNQLYKKVISNHDRKYIYLETDLDLKFYIGSNENDKSIYLEILNPLISVSETKRNREFNNREPYHFYKQPDPVYYQSPHSIKLNNLDHLKTILKRLKTKFRFEIEWDILRKDLIQGYKCQEYQLGQWWVKYDEEDFNYFVRLFDYYKDDHDCMDNKRVADMSKRLEVKRYKKMKDDGCCGFHDEIIEYKGKRYLFGFNYGH